MILILFYLFSIKFFYPNHKNINKKWFDTHFAYYFFHFFDVVNLMKSCSAHILHGHLLSNNDFLSAYCLLSRAFSGKSRFTIITTYKIINIVLTAYLNHTLQSE